MKRLLSKTFKGNSLALKPSPATPVTGNPATTNPPVHHTGLQPKDTLPPVPHPCPYEYISVVATAGGLVLRHRHPGQAEDSNEVEVKIEWGKGGKVMLVSEGTVEADWEDSAVIYGIVGCLELFSGNKTRHDHIRIMLSPVHSILRSGRLLKKCGRGL